MRTALLAGLALLAAATLTACGGGGSSSGACGSACNGCCLGTQCVAGTDVTGCGTGSKDCKVCTAGQACSAGLCGGQAAAAIADKCTTGADCGAGNACAADVPGGGYCTSNCTASGSCPTGATCLALSATSKICVKTCSTDANCRAEHLCFVSNNVGLCLPKCTQDADCDSGICDTGTGRCGTPRIGNPCATDASCGSTPAFCDLTDPSGYCSTPCGGQKNTPCPNGSNCSSIGGASVCLKGCKVPGDCRTGFSCTPDSSGLSSCTPKCTATSQCAPGLKCDTGSGACVEGGPASGQLGGACTAVGDCPAAPGGETAFCATAANGYPKGYCSLSCNSSNSACGAAGTCVNFAPGDNDCLSKCSVPSDCRIGYYCFDLGGGFGGVCTPKCTANTDCSGGTICDKNSGLCVQPAAGGTTTDPVDLTPGGAIDVSTTTLSAPLTITVPKDAVSITFIGQGVSDPSARLVVYRIESSADGRIYEYNAVASKMKVLAPTGAGAFSVLLPNSPDVPFTTSTDSTAVTVTIKLLASKATTATVKALVKRSPTRALTAGKISLNLFFVGLPNLNAASAPTDANFKTIFDSVKSTWAKAGISVDAADVSYIDITGADATRFRDLKDTDLGLLMTKTLNPGAKDNALNVFFVHTISGGSLEGYIILGESAGIPGVPVRGTTGSGMAVTSADFPGGLQDIADTWAHEGGHWLGLFHPTESGGTSFDPLADTPQCTKDRDANGNGNMEPSECINFGADNEMFWTSTASIAHSNLTPNQSFVLLRNPAVH